MALLSNHHKPVRAERKGRQAANVHGPCNNADIADTFGNQPDNLVRQLLLKVDADLGIGGQKGAQHFRQEFGEGVGVGQEADFSGETLGEGAQILPKSSALCED